VTVLRIQAGAVLATYVIAWGGFVLLSIRRHRALLVANAVALVVSGATVLALGPAFGAVGGGVATLLGESSLAIAYAVALFRARPDLRLTYEIVPRLAAATALALAALLLPVAPAVELVIAAVVFIAAVLALRVAPSEIWGELRRRGGTSPS
jgi:O-antigen/teichoic acid export membrane protein